MNQNPFLKSWGSLFKERAVPKPSGITRAAYAEASDLRSWPFRPWIALVFLLIFQACGSSAAVLLPLEFQQGVTFYNFQSARGVPISTTKNVPPGSDGRMPTVNESAGSLLLPTTNQFQGFIGFGAVATRTNPAAVANSPILNGSNAFSAAVASAMQLPMASSDGSVLMVLRRAQVGAPYLSRQVSFAFGAVVSVPSVDENGNTLTNIVPEAYWAAEPYTTNSHAGSGYYWSPNARKVYAIQPGPIKVTWVKSAYATGAHPPATNGVSYITNSTGNIFTLYTANYLVSGAPVKPPRRMYWTEKSFRTIGKPVAVPTARVGSVYIVYNSNFPQTVTNEYVAPGDSSPTDGTGSQTLPILRTLWYESGNFLAYNVEGRVFVELLGDARQDGTREQLGFEIVDVYKQPALLDVTVELGDRILPPAPGRLEELTPDPILQPSGPDFAYQHSPGGNVALYAARETSNVNDYLVHWLEEGLVGIKWPALLGRYKMVWPTDPARYSHYVRPRVATENEARTTAVPLPTQNVPVIQYQDPLDKPRGKLTETFAFYTFLEPPYSAHRTLLRFSSGENVYFERVFSWLDSELKTSNFANNPIVTNLPAWDRTNNVFEWPDVFTAPRVLIGEGVVVGDRIVAPYGEAGDQFFDPNYLAGYIKQSAGTSFNPHTYVDPFVSGFEAANKGAIIPVNAIPGSNTLEVWWFRRNPDNSAKGFLPIYWPSVVSQYNILWPEENERVPREIVLASNKGSEGDGPLDTFEANGRIYYQNDRNQVGYNPN